MLLFGMECKKIAGSILYWVLVLALLAVVLFQYGSAVESELRRTGDPDSVFYIASDGSYAKERNGSSDESVKHAMMVGAANRLISSYRSNRYEYYPFGYVKEKTLSAAEQAAVLKYLTELTGLSEQTLNGITDRTDDARIGDLPISGGGAFILDPGKGSTNENGQFVAEPEDWQFVSKSGDQQLAAQTEDQQLAEESGNQQFAAQTEGQQLAEETEDSFEIRVSYERFQEIMEEVNKLIGRNSYFSRTMLTLYYFGSDMEDAPITERQHLEFYEGDRVTGAFARYYCDSISLVVLFLPAFVIIDLMLRDKRRKMQGLTYPRTISSVRAVCTRYAAAVCMAMLPVLVLPLKSLYTLMRFCSSIGVQADALAFVKYSFAWILPTVLLVMAVSLFVTALLENYAAVLLTGLIWLAGRPSVDKLAGGNYGLFDLIIRHNTLKGYGRMMEHMQMLVLNRIIISIAALALVGLSVLVYSRKRKGGLAFGRQKSAHNHRLELSPER